MPPVFDPSLFIRPSCRSYLMTAGEGLVPASAVAQHQRYLADKVAGPEGRRQLEEVDQDVRRRLAGLMGATAGDIALLPNASAGIAAVCAMIDWKPTDNIVVMTSDLEFPSTLIPAHALVRDHGVELRIVDHQDWIVSPEAIVAAVDENTKLIALSHVSYRTGYRVDLSRLRQLLGDHPAIVLVDATQSLGVFTVPADVCDFLVASSCKWLMAPHGIGVFYWNRARRPDAVPRDRGWFSVVDDLSAPYELKPDASRFELGSASWSTAYAMQASLEIIEGVGLPAIESHVAALAGRALEGLLQLDLEIITPLSAVQRAGIVCWLDANPSGTAGRLAEAGVWVTGSAGRIRTSFHGYTSEAEVDALLEVMSSCSS